MRAVIDACVLYPTLTRGLILRLAEAGRLTPLWSERLLEEWRRTAVRRGDGAEGEAALHAVRARFPMAQVPAADAALEARLWLPDAGDIHVLATAVAARAEAIITFNLKDFPTRELYAHDVRALHPDTVLTQAWLEVPDLVEQAVRAGHTEAEARAGRSLSCKALLKRARLPRLAKALAA